MLEAEGGQVLYCFNYLDLTETPDISGNEIVDRLRDVFMQGLSATPSKETVINVRGYPGKDVEAANPERAVLRARIVYAEMCGYMVYVLAMPGRAPEPLDDQFLNGFQLSDHP